MQWTSRNQQLENHRSNLIAEQIALFKNVFDSCFKSIVSPGFVPENIAHFGSYLALTLIFFLDVNTDPAISFHILYIFPITFIALHSSRTGMAAGAVTLSVSLQCVTPFLFQNHAVESHVYLCLLIAFTNITCALAARYLRAHILEVKRLSTIDPLTQLCNRRGLEKVMEMEAVRQRRKGECSGHFSLAALDLDGFKGLNDTKGHKAGDEALILLSGVLRNQLRQTDTICRVGGDEFVVLMPNTEASDCHALCQLLCQTIRLKLTEAFAYPLSVSIGFTTSANSTVNSIDLLSIVRSGVNMP
jgi:diguanylate cyclase (GGDEF)-like protein